MPVHVTGIHDFFFVREHVDGRDKPGHDANGESARGQRLSSAVSKREPDSRGSGAAMTGRAVSPSKLP